MKHLFPFLSCAIFLAAVTVSADTVELRKGRRMTGTIVSRDDEHLVLDVGKGRVTLNMRDIRSIRFDSPESAEAAASPYRVPKGHVDRSNMSLWNPVRQTPAGALQGADLEQLVQDLEALGMDGALPPEVQQLLGSDGSMGAPPSAGGLGLEAGSPPSPDELTAMVDRLLPEMAALRGLSPRGQVAKRVVDKAAVRRTLLEALDREYPGDMLAHKSRALAMLGALPPGVNLREAITQLYTHQIAGIYDPLTDTLFLADWIPAALQETTVAHELVHALQDQHMDLERFTDAVKEDSDATTARQAVVEGDALAAQLAYQLRGQGMSIDQVDLTQQADMLAAMVRQSDPSLASLPPLLEDLLLFPYLSGLRFVQAAMQHGSWSALAGVYADPPASTEQIIHPERYLSRRDEPTLMQLPDLSATLGAGWRAVDEDALGEFGVLSLMRQRLGLEAGRSAAAGWDGDRYALYEGPDGGWFVAWVSTWDSVEDAEEFARGYRAGSSGDQTIDQRGAWVVTLVGGVGDRAGGEGVPTRDGATAQAREAALSALWKTLPAR